MSSPPQCSKDDGKDVTPTAPTGKHQETVPPHANVTAPTGEPNNDEREPFPHPHHEPSPTENPIEMVKYVVPTSVETAAAPPVRTLVETTSTTGASTPNVPHSNNDYRMSETVSTTRVVTLQPFKVVYYYADDTQHTYVLQNSPAEISAFDTQHKFQQRYQPATMTGKTMGNAHGVRMRRRHGGVRWPSSSARSPAAEVPTVTQTTRIPASHGGDSSSLMSFDSGASDIDERASATADEAADQKLLLFSKPCATCGRLSCLAAAYRPPEYVADITPANPRVGSPGPVTLFAFGFTTCLYNVHQAGICPMNLTTMGLICFYGGLAQFVGGFFELVNKNTIFCTLDVTYGSFWMATAIAALVPENSNVVAAAPKNFMGGFFMLWFFFAATMFASSFKFSYVQMLLNFSVALNFFLNLLGSFTGSATLLHVAGFEGIVEGCLATYVGMAFTLRDIYGYSILPLFFQKNFKITEW